LNTYEKQVRILLRVLALIDFDDPEGKGSPFLALKGGTASGSLSNEYTRFPSTA
jgi:hypothetical protein